MKTVHFPYYYPKTFQLDKYDHATPFLAAALIPCDCRVHVLDSKKEVFFLRNMMWKADSVMQIFRSGTFRG